MVLGDKPSPDLLQRRIGELGDVLAQYILVVLELRTRSSRPGKRRRYPCFATPDQHLVNVGNIDLKQVRYFGGHHALVNQREHPITQILRIRPAHVGPHAESIMRTKNQKALMAGIPPIPSIMKTL